MLETSEAARAIALANEEVRKLRKVEAALDLYEERKRGLKIVLDEDVHGNIVGPLVEAPLREYLADTLPPTMKLGEGFPVLDLNGKPKSAQVDLVVDFGAAKWHSAGGSHSHHEEVPVYAAAMEARYRGAYLRNKGPGAVASSVMEVVKRLQAILDEGVRSQRKCWTTAVLFGPGFSTDAPDEEHGDDEQQDENNGSWAVDPVIRRILERLAAFYMSRKLAPQSLAGVPTSWPFVDAISMPGVLIKKHTLFEEPRLGAKEHPIFAVQPFANTDIVRLLRPLATLKGHLRHVLACIAADRDFEVPAWGNLESLRFLGPTPGYSECRTHLRAAVLDGFEGRLFHAGYDGEQVVWQPYVPDPVAGAPVWMPELLLERSKT